MAISPETKASVRKKHFFNQPCISSVEAVAISQSLSGPSASSQFLSLFLSLTSCLVCAMFGVVIGCVFAVVQPISRVS